MNVKVIKEFRDKHTNKRYPVGHIIENVSEERVKEILSKGKLVEEVSEEVSKAAKETEEPVKEVAKEAAEKKNKKETKKTTK